MQRFLLWCAVFLGLYAGIGFAYHVYLSRHPRKVVVAVDTSYPMHMVWAQIPATLATIETQRYTQFSLITDKARVHSWQPRLTWDARQPYAPRAFSQMLDRQTYPELAEADEVYVLTNAEPRAIAAGTLRLRFVQLQPTAP